MCNSIKNKILARIYGHGKGWTFSTFDFMGEFKRYEIDCALSSLWRENKIRRICRGIYDYPIYSSILKRDAAPDINAIAAALARKFRWQIYPTGDTALNYFGISKKKIVSLNFEIESLKNRQQVTYIVTGPPDSLKTGAMKAEPAKAEPAKAEPVKAEPVKAEPVKAEPVKAEPAKAEPVKAEPAKI